MTDQTTSPDTPPAGIHAGMSRRRLLIGGGVGLSIAAISRLGSGSAGAIAGELNSPGRALVPAVRVTTTTTVAPLGVDEILFPIVVGVDDYCSLTNNFGDPRWCCRSHEGTDIMADHLLPIRAVANGRLTKRYEELPATAPLGERKKGAGNGWTLLDEENDITYKFFHMDHHAEGLKVGDEVEIGQVIGAVGNTGTSGVSDGVSDDYNYHLHFEYRPNNIAQNSYFLLQRDPNVYFY
jgi:hypothetical protein